MRTEIYYAVIEFMSELDKNGCEGVVEMIWPHVVYDQLANELYASAKYRSAIGDHDVEYPAGTIRINASGRSCAFIKRELALKAKGHE